MKHTSAALTVLLAISAVDAVRPRKKDLRKKKFKKRTNEPPPTASPSYVPTEWPTWFPTVEPENKPTKKPTPGINPSAFVDAVDDTIALPPGTEEAFIGVLANDIGDNLVVAGITQQAGFGTCSITINLKEVTYRPASATFLGQDVCEYEACDDDDDCDTATITIQVKEEGTYEPTISPPPPRTTPAPSRDAGTSQTLAPTRGVPRTDFPTEQAGPLTNFPTTRAPTGMSYSYYDSYDGKKDYLSHFSTGKSGKSSSKSSKSWKPSSKSWKPSWSGSSSSSSSRSWKAPPSWSSSSSSGDKWHSSWSGSGKSGKGRRNLRRGGRVLKK